MPMKLTEMEERCVKVEKSAKLLEQLRGSLERLESEARDKSKESQMRREIARIRGEEPPPEPKLDELEKIRAEIANLKNEDEQFRKEIYEGMKEISLPIQNEIPSVDPKGNSSIRLVDGSYDCSVRFVAEMINSDEPLELDRTQFYPDRIVVGSVRDSADVIERLKTLRDNLGRLARIALKETDPDVEVAVKYLHDSDYRDLWEMIGGRKRISYEDLYKERKSDEKDKKRIRNFFTNVEKQLNTKFPFIHTDSGTYELSFFGSLVWRRYGDKYAEPCSSKEALSEAAAKEEDSKREEKKAPVRSLNGYLSNEGKELIYGKESD